MPSLPLDLQRIARLATPSAAKLWQQCHLSRRSAVLALLSGRGPDFDTLLTIRSPTLSYGGDAAFPGGKAENTNESVWDVAFREANEEIGLASSEIIPAWLMPGYLSSNGLLVVPAVGFWARPRPLARVDGEVHKVFTAKLSEFLPETSGKLTGFSIPARQRTIGEPLNDHVWGLTAHILVDLARQVLQREPQFTLFRGNQPAAARNSLIGNPEQISHMLTRGVLQSPRVSQRKGL